MSIYSTYPPIVAVSGERGVKFEDCLSIIFCPGVGGRIVSSCPGLAINLLYIELITLSKAVSP